MLPPPPEPPWAVIWGGGGGGRPGCCPRAPRAPGCCWGRSPPPPSGSAPTTTSSAGPAPFGGGVRGGGGQRAAAGIWRGVPIPPTCCTCRVSPILTLSSCEFLPWNSYSTRTTGGGWRGGLGGRGGGSGEWVLPSPLDWGGGMGGSGCTHCCPPGSLYAGASPASICGGRAAGGGKLRHVAVPPPPLTHPPCPIPAGYLQSAWGGAASHQRTWGCRGAPPHHWGTAPCGGGGGWN